MSGLYDDLPSVRRQIRRAYANARPSYSGSAEAGAHRVIQREREFDDWLAAELDAHTPPSEPATEHVVHVTALPVGEDVVWCEECEEWVTSGAPACEDGVFGSQDIADALGGRGPLDPAPVASGATTSGCYCPPCPGRGNDGHGLTHCAECCFGTGVEADIDCPSHGDARATTSKPATCYCPNRGDDYHLSGDPGCVSAPVATGATTSEDEDATCWHAEPEGECASCAACAACGGECGTCPYSPPVPQPAPPPSSDTDRPAAPSDLQDTPRLGREDRDTGLGEDDGPECETCGRTTCPDAQLAAFSEPVDCEYAPIYEELRAAKDCDYGCSRDFTNQELRLWLVPAVEQMLAARARVQPEGTDRVVTKQYRAVSPDGRLPEGFKDWPTWGGRGITLDYARRCRDEWHPGYRLEVEVTRVGEWETVGGDEG